MSFRPGIPWRGALQRCPPPLPRLSLFCNLAVRYSTVSKKGAVHQPHNQPVWLMIISMSLKQLAEYGGIFRTPPLSILRPANVGSGPGLLKKSRDPPLKRRRLPADRASEAAVG